MNELEVHNYGGNNAVLILVTPSAEMNIFFHKKMIIKQYVCMTFLKPHIIN